MGVVHRYVMILCQCWSVLQVRRNLTEHHIMMEGTALYPGGFHPSWQDMSPDCKSDAVASRRIDAPPVRYYFIDFSQATQLQSTDVRSTSDGSGPQEGHDGTPEQSTDELYLPFQVDVYSLGQIYRSAFIDARTVPWGSISSHSHNGFCFHLEIHQCRLPDIPGRRNDYRYGISSTVSG